MRLAIPSLGRSHLWNKSMSGKGNSCSLAALRRSSLWASCGAEVQVAGEEELPSGLLPLIGIFHIRAREDDICHCSPDANCLEQVI